MLTMVMVMVLTEVEEWERVNKTLRQHGLTLVELAHPSQADSKSDLVMLEPDISRKLRDNLKTLMRDCDRRQELIQELILTNNQLREELKTQCSLTEKYEDKVKDLAAMLDTFKSKVQEMEEDQINSTMTAEEDGEKLRNTMDAVKAKNKQLQQKCTSYEAEVERLQHKVQKMSAENDRRRQKQNEVFQQLRKRSSRGPIDDKILDIIDSYERQIYALKHDVELSRLGDSVVGEGESRGHSETLTISEDTPTGTPNYKALIKCYEKQLREASRNMKAAENENEMLRLELQSRPEMADLREARLHIKKLEKQLKKKEHLRDQQLRTGAKYSTQINDVEYLPASHCHHYLQVICNELGVSDLEHLLAKIQMDSKAVEAFPRLQQLTSEVLSIIETPNTPRPPGYKHHTPASHRPHQVWCEKSCHKIIPVLQHWQRELQALKELQQSVNNLHGTMLPWKQTRLTGLPSVTKLIEAVDCLVYEDDDAGHKGESHSKEQPSTAMLRGILDHFMNLFDVKRVAGCYARMNNIYSKLGEVHNVLKTLKALLGLETDAKSSAVVDSVARLCQAHNTSSYQQLHQWLPSQDLHSVVKKLEQQEEFFPVFQELMQEMIQMLGVQRIDQIVPAVKALKSLANS